MKITIKEGLKKDRLMDKWIPYVGAIDFCCIEMGELAERQKISINIGGVTYCGTSDDSIQWNVCPFCGEQIIVNDKRKE